jgi:hypothetical protein
MNHAIDTRTASLLSAIRCFVSAIHNDLNWLNLGSVAETQTNFKGLLLQQEQL